MKTTLKLWTRPDSYIGATWYDWYSVVGQHRDSDALTRSNWQCWIKWLTKLIGEPGEVDYDDPEFTPQGWIIVRENHWAVGWVEWIGIHKDVSPEVIEMINDKLADLDGYPVFDESHWSELEDTEYQACFSDHHADRDWMKELRSWFSECQCSHVLDYIDDKLDWQWVTSVHEKFIPSGEYFNSDNSGIWPHVDMSIKGMHRDDLAQLARALRRGGTSAVVDWCLAIR